MPGARMEPLPLLTVLLFMPPRALETGGLRSCCTSSGGWSLVKCRASRERADERLSPKASCKERETRHVWTLQVYAAEGVIEAFPLFNTYHAHPKAEGQSTTAPYELLRIHLTHRVCDVNFVVLQVQNLQHTAAAFFFICVVAASQRSAEGRRTSSSNPGVVERQRSKRGVPAKPLRERDRAVVADGVMAQF